jgi:DnaK suppressor protein
VFWDEPHRDGTTRQKTAGSWGHRGGKLEPVRLAFVSCGLSQTASTKLALVSDCAGMGTRSTKKMPGQRDTEAIRGFLENLRGTLDDQLSRGAAVLHNSVDTRSGAETTECADSADLPVLLTQATYMSHAVNRALARLAAGRYGRCEECDEPIASPRLRALPFATRCLECQVKFEDGQVTSGTRRHPQVWPD